MGVSDNVELSARMVAHLRGKGAVNDVQLAVAARHFEAGILPSTALRRAGVSHDFVLEALAVASHLPAAPPPTVWRSDALHLTGLSATSWTRARAVPIGTVNGRVLIAFADPRLVDGAREVLPPHDALCCLEEDFDAALASLLDGATLLPPPSSSRSTPVPVMPDSTEPALAPGPLTGAPLSLASPAPPPASAARLPKTRSGVGLDASSFGPWKVERELARGGMGIVYLAHDAAGRPAALKVIHPHLLSDADVRARFLREARTTERVKHRNVVAVLDVGDENLAWLAVEYVDGGTVMQLLRRQGRLPLPAALELVFQMLEGLQEAHAHNVVHRDLKPSNLLLSKDGTVKIVDFGVARELDATALTQTGSTLGTPAYMSPEQARAEPIDARSDLYTAGVILYELLAGRKPFSADSLGGLVAQILAGRATPLFELDPAIPEAVDDLVALLMRPNPAARPTDAATVIGWLRPIVEEHRRKRPRLLAELLADPECSSRLRHEQADALVARARALLQSGASAREAAALQLHRAQRLLPEHVDAAKLLEGLTPQGLWFGPAKNPKLVEVEKEISARPDDPVLLRRAGQLARQDGNVYKAAVYWRRYLRLRPEDDYTQQQLARLLAPPTPSDATLKIATAQLVRPESGGTPISTVERIAGHIETGGIVVSDQSPLRVVQGAPLAPADVVETPLSDQLRAMASVHGGKMIAAVAAVLLFFVFVRGVGAFIDSSHAQINESWRGAAPKPRAKSRDDADASHKDVTLALEALAAAEWAEAELRAHAAITRGAPDDTLAGAYVARGRARLEQGKPLAAVEDFSRVIDSFRNADVYPEALLRRGQAHARAGDGVTALVDLNACIAARGSQPILGEARLERGLIKKAGGAVAEARADLQWVLDYLRLGPARDKARAALADLGAP